VFPERATRMVVKDFLHMNEQPDANPDWATRLEVYREDFDRKDEDDWRQRCVAFARKCDNEPPMKEARKAGAKALLAEPERFRQTLAHFVQVILPDAVSRCPPTAHSLVATPGQANFGGITIDEFWMMWRELFTMGFYSLINAVENPDTYSHQRLNQRMDRRYLEYLWPGGMLATRDKEMMELARLMSPRVRILSEPSDIQSL